MLEAVTKRSVLDQDWVTSVRGRDAVCLVFGYFLSFTNLTERRHFRQVLIDTASKVNQDLVLVKEPSSSGSHR